MEYPQVWISNHWQSLLVTFRGQWGTLRYLSQELGHWTSNLHQPQQVDRSDHFLIDTWITWILSNLWDPIIIKKHWTVPVFCIGLYGIISSLTLVSNKIFFYPQHIPDQTLTRKASRGMFMGSNFCSYVFRLFGRFDSFWHFFWTQLCLMHRVSSLTLSNFLPSLGGKFVSMNGPNDRARQGHINLSRCFWLCLWLNPSCKFL